MVRGAGRRRKKLYRFELSNVDDPQAVQVLHKLEIRATSREGLAPVVVHSDDVI